MAIRKHGKENFIREILEFCSSRDELALRESEIINLNEISKEDCMNMKVGGYGGGMIWNDDHMRNFSKAGNEAFKHNLQNDPALKESFRLQGSNHFKDFHKKGHFKYDTFKGRSHSEESKKRMSDSSKETGVGETNSQYGTYWITNGKENKKIKKDEFIPEGYYKGRKIK